MKDPVVEEVRKIRHEMDRLAGYDFERFIAMLRENERKRMEKREHP